jgi:cytochrome c-type biogenesis protein CcmH
MIWIAFFLLVAVVLWLLLRPLLQPPAAISDARTSDLSVYREQLRELEGDLARGLISPAEADAARTEIKRKMLAVAPAPEAAHNPQRAARLARVAVGAGLPMLALGLYLSVGRPNLPGKDFSAVPTEAQQQTGQIGDIETMAARLAERLKTNPTDAQGWRMLGLAYANIDRAQDAAMAFERAVALDGKNAALLAQYGESLVRVSNGLVTPEAENIFERTLAIDAKEPRAQFFRGLALEQHGKPKEALAAWVKLIREGQADAEWLPAVRQRAVELAVKLKLDPGKEVPGAIATASAATAPPVVDAKEIGAAPAHEDPAALVERLSKRLETSPKDYEGWILLARTYRSLGKSEMARASLARAKEIFAGAPFVLQQIAAAESDLAQTAGVAPPTPAPVRGPTPDDVAAVSQLPQDEQNKMILGMIEGLEARLRRNSNDLEGWLMLARSRKVMGDTNAARTALGRAKELFGKNVQAQARIVQVATELQLN